MKNAPSGLSRTAYISLVSVMFSRTGKLMKCVWTLDIIRFYNDF